MKRMRELCLAWSLLTAMAVFTSLPSVGRAADEIVGGIAVKKPDSIERSVVALYREHDGSATLCTATLIAKDMALTAAHCVDSGIDGMKIMFGTDIRDADEVSIKVLGAEVPPAREASETAPRDQADIAVIHFEGELPQGYKPALLASIKSEIAEGDSVILAGFGIDDAKTQAGAGVLRKTRVTVADPDFGKTEIVFDQQSGSGACHGDSGGPAFLEKNGRIYLLGVTNRSYPDNAPDDCRHEVVYTKVNAYRRWITEAEKALRGTR